MKTSARVKIMSWFLAVLMGMSPVWEAQGALNVPVSRPMTAEATVTGTTVLNIALKNSSDDQAASKITFASGSGIPTASQYVQVDFDSNSVGARIVVRTDNKNASIPFTGTGEGAGLVGNADSKVTVPLLWAVFDDVAPAKAFVFKGDTDPSGTNKGTLPGSTERGAGEAEGLVVDKNNKTPAGDPAKGEIGGYEDPRVQGYATVVVPTGTTGSLGSFPTDEDGAGAGTGLRPCTSPVFFVMGSALGGVSAQKYSTDKLALDLITQ